MQLTQIRNATVIIEYADRRFLVDPVLAEKGAYPGFPGTPRSELRNPLVGLPMSLGDILRVEAVIVTHTHLDHWDEAAARLIPKEMTIFSQNERDAEAISSAGFQDVRILSGEVDYKGIKLRKTSGRHGSEAAYANPEMAKQLGEVSGVLFRHPSEKTVYLTGDTVWNEKVAEVLATYRPDIIIANAGESQYIEFGAIIMGAADLMKVHAAAPEALIIATHMEAMNLAPLSRRDLRSFAEQHGFSGNLLIPADGETLAI